MWLCRKLVVCAARLLMLLRDALEPLDAGHSRRSTRVGQRVGHLGGREHDLLDLGQRHLVVHHVDVDLLRLGSRLPELHALRRTAPVRRRAQHPEHVHGEPPARERPALLAVAAAALLAVAGTAVVTTASKICLLISVNNLILNSPISSQIIDFLTLSFVA